MKRKGRPDRSTYPCSVLSPPYSDSPLCRPGDDLLSRVLRQSTIGAEAFDGRVRDGIGSCRFARATRPAKGGSEDGIRRTEDGWSALGCPTLVVRREAKLVGIEAGRPERESEGQSVLRSLYSVFRHTLLDYENNQAERAISTGKLRVLPRFHTRPINVVVFHGSSGRNGFEAGFPLRCLQRLSIPYIATLHRGWRHDRSTRDTFTPVLSY